MVDTQDMEAQGWLEFLIAFDVTQNIFMYNFAEYVG